MMLGPRTNSRPPEAMPSTGSMRVSRPGSRPPTVPRPVVVRLVHRDHRRGFGRAIAFQHRHAAEPLGDQICGSRRAPSRRRRPRTSGRRSRPGSAARAYWFTKVSVAEQDGGLRVPHSGGICFVCSGEGYSNAFMPVSSGRSTPAGQAEAVEGRQRVEQHPVRIEVDVGGDLLDVGEQVRLAQHHALAARRSCRR